jgi:hypothetical protein
VFDICPDAEARVPGPLELLALEPRSEPELLALEPAASGSDTVCESSFADPLEAV